jgi:hypothetical protein
MQPDAHLPGFSRGVHRMGMAAPIYYTADMVRALPADGSKYEPCTASCW